MFGVNERKRRAALGYETGDLPKHKSEWVESLVFTLLTIYMLLIAAVVIVITAFRRAFFGKTISQDVDRASAKDH